MKSIEAIARIIKAKMKHRARIFTETDMRKIEIFSEPVDYEYFKRTEIKEHHFIQLSPKAKFYIKENIAKHCIAVYYILEGMEMDLDHPWLEIPHEILEDLDGWIDRNNPSKRKRKRN